MATATLSRPTPRTSGFDARTFGNAFIEADRALHEGHALTANQRLTIIQALAHVGLRDLLITHLDAYGPELWESLGDEATQVHMRSAAEAYTLAVISGAIHNNADRDRLLNKAKKHYGYTTTNLFGLMERSFVLGKADGALKAVRRGAEIARESFDTTVLSGADWLTAEFD